MMEVETNSVRFTNYCTAHGQELTASATTSATWNDVTFEILGTAQDEQALNHGDFKMNCNVDIKPMKLRYKFKGACLVLTQTGSKESLTLVPAR